MDVDIEDLGIELGAISNQTSFGKWVVMPKLLLDADEIARRNLTEQPI